MSGGFIIPLLLGLAFAASYLAHLATKPNWSPPSWLCNAALALFCAFFALIFALVALAGAAWAAGVAAWRHGRKSAARLRGELQGIWRDFAR